ncbi:MAG TPA: hypothetical protein VL442_15560 [Mucilaginibacter sp.]|jgi:hypothetical protein|nr:hypothetical protein [Mucilaginibacter sp.]
MIRSKTGMAEEVSLRNTQPANKVFYRYTFPVGKSVANYGNRR